MPESDLDHAPIAAGGVEGVPVIDIGDLLAGNRNPARASVRAIAAACRDWGFFQVVNHGIEARVIDAAWRETRDFFALPAAEKEALLRTRENPWGYYNNELTKNQRDKKEVFDFTSDGTDPIFAAVNRWPRERPSFRETLCRYRDACSRLSQTLLEAMSIGLGLPADCLARYFHPAHTGFVRLNYYPVRDPLENRPEVTHLAAADRGVHHHTDAGALTVLLQDGVGGLQVFRDGYWYDVPPTDGAFVINTGDMLQVWSNDHYRAAIHRVLAMEDADRYSIPLFFNPKAGTTVGPLASTVSPERPARYAPIDWSAFRYRRTDGDYADYGTEVQISQFRLQS